MAFAHKYVRGTVILTVLALVLAMLSLTLPWYRVALVWTYDGTRYYDDTIEFSLRYYDDDDPGLTAYGYHRYENVYSLLNFVTAFIALWSILALIYLAAIIPCKANSPMDRKDGYVLGWVLVVLGLLPSFVFGLAVAGSYNADTDRHISSFIGTDGLSEWGPMSGWYVALMAGLVQTIAVLARNVPILQGKAEDSEDASDEASAYGDLPMR